MQAKERRCTKCNKVFRSGERYCDQDGTALPIPDPLIDDVLGRRFKILRRLGEGGMGVVYLAQHVHLENHFAIKVMTDEYARDDVARQRFLREAQAARRVKHEHIVDVVDFALEKRPQLVPDSVLYLVMEYLQGDTLRNLLNRTPNQSLQLDRTLHIVIQIAQALQHLHSHRVVHRDIKPDNVFLVGQDGDKDYVKLVDFGLARLLDQKALTINPQLPAGTYNYISPEAWEDPEGVAPPMDLYALGVVLFECLTGRAPFPGNTWAALMHAHTNAPVPRISTVRPDLSVPREIDDLCARLLVKKPQQRPDAKSLISELQALQGRFGARTVVEKTLPAIEVETFDKLDPETVLQAEGDRPWFTQASQEFRRLEHDLEKASILTDHCTGALIVRYWPRNMPESFVVLTTDNVLLQAEISTHELRITDLGRKLAEERQRVLAAKTELQEQIQKLRTAVETNADDSAARQYDARLQQLEQQYFQARAAPELSNALLSAEFDLYHLYQDLHQNRLARGRTVLNELARRKQIGPKDQSVGEDATVKQLQVASQSLAEGLRQIASLFKRFPTIKPPKSKAPTPAAAK